MKNTIEQIKQDKKELLEILKRKSFESKQYAERCSYLDVIRIIEDNKYFNLDIKND